MQGRWRDDGGWSRLVPLCRTAGLAVLTSVMLRGVWLPWAEHHAVAVWVVIRVSGGVSAWPAVLVLGGASGLEVALCV
jgi:hypothetical protein